MSVKITLDAYSGLKLTVKTIEAVPEINPASTFGNPTDTVMLLKPLDRELWIFQDYKSSPAVPHAEYHGIQYRLWMGGHAKKSEIVRFIHDNKTLFRDVIEGHSIRWDGSNRIGRLTQDAHEKLDLLHVIFCDLADHDAYNIIRGDDIYEYAIADLLKLGSTAEVIAEKLYADLAPNHVILGGQQAIEDVIFYMLEDYPG